MTISIDTGVKITFDENDNIQIQDMSLQLDVQTAIILWRSLNNQLALNDFIDVSIFKNEPNIPLNVPYLTEEQTQFANKRMYQSINY